ncbi:hypothetical protein R6Q57_011382 [Mikania cordata]
MVDSDAETDSVCKDPGLSESDVNEDDVCLQQKKKGKRLMFSNSDEDTTVAARQKELKDSKVGKTKTSVMDTWFSIKNRCSPTQLTKVVKSLTSRQKEIIERLGFGKLLSLQLDGIPQKLGHFVEQNFNEVKMEICLENGVIKIDVEAIHKLLGIPKTRFNLKSMPARRRLCPRIQQWRDLYGKECMSPRDISSRMAVDVSDDSLDFELDFLVLFMSTMVECQAHGKCILEMLYYLDDYIDLSVIKWSAYVFGLHQEM